MFNDYTLKQVWEDLPSRYKLGGAVILLLLIGVAVSGWLSSFSAWSQIRTLDKQVQAIEKEKQQLQKNLELIGKQVKTKEAEQQVIEAKREKDVKKYEDAKKQVDTATADYNSARSNPRTDSPDASTVCAELAELGYSCADAAK